MDKGMWSELWSEARYKKIERSLKVELINKHDTFEREFKGEKTISHHLILERNNKSYQNIQDALKKMPSWS